MFGICVCVCWLVTALNSHRRCKERLFNLSRKLCCKNFIVLLIICHTISQFFISADDKLAIRVTRWEKKQKFFKYFRYFAFNCVGSATYLYINGEGEEEIWRQKLRYSSYYWIMMLRFSFGDIKYLYWMNFYFGQHMSLERLPIRNIMKTSFWTVRD